MKKIKKFWIARDKGRVPRRLEMPKIGRNKFTKDQDEIFVSGYFGWINEILLGIKIAPGTQKCFEIREVKEDRSGFPQSDPPHDHAADVFDFEIWESPNEYVITKRGNLIGQTVNRRDALTISRWLNTATKELEK